MTLELPWAADEAVQQLGRTNRANQASAPHYVLPQTDIAGEGRIVGTLASRLAAMGAITQGDRCVHHAPPTLTPT